MKRRDDLVSASEIASWAWCPESWRLSTLGWEPSNRDDMARGERRHSFLAFFESWSRSVVRLGWLLLVWGLIIALAAFVLAVLR